MLTLFIIDNSMIVKMPYLLGALKWVPYDSPVTHRGFNGSDSLFQ